MIHYLALCLFAIGVGLSHAGETFVDPMSDVMRETVKNVMAECQHYHNCTFQEYLNYYWTNKEVTNENEKCYLACTLEKLGVIDEDGIMDVESTKKLNRMKYPTNNMLIEKADAITDACYQQEKYDESIDKCEKGYRIIKCFFNEAIKLFAQ